MRTYSVIDIDLDSLVDEVVNNVINEEEYTTNTVVCDSELAVKLVAKILAIKDSFDAVDVDTSMTGFYYVTITSDFELFCQPICYDGKCMWNESDYTYVQDNIPQKFLKYLGNKWKVIFGIED
jgi:hypothetical protein